MVQLHAGLNRFLTGGKSLIHWLIRLLQRLVVLALVIQEQLPLWFLLIIVIRDVLILLGGAIAAHRITCCAHEYVVGKGSRIYVVFDRIMGACWKLINCCLTSRYVVTTVLFIYSFILYVIRFIDVMAKRKEQTRRRAGNSEFLFCGFRIETEPQNSN